MSKRNLKKLILIAGAILCLMALVLIVFHHHADGEHTRECFVCRFVHAFALVFISAAGLFLSFSSRKFTPVPVQKFTPRLPARSLKDRSPPFFV